MATPADIRAAMADSLRPLGYQVSPYVLDNPTPPCAYVRSGPISYDKTMGRGHDDWEYIVTVLVGYVSDIGAQTKLDEFLASHGERSVKTLLESDRTLGGAVESLWVEETTGVRVYVVPPTITGGQSPAQIGAEWTVRVMASGVH